jgi:hypothetical protein
MHFCEASAKTNENVQKIFFDLSKAILEKVVNNEIDVTNEVSSASSSHN